MLSIRYYWSKTPPPPPRPQHTHLLRSFLFQAGSRVWINISFILTPPSHLVHFHSLASIQDNRLSGFVWRQFYYSPKPIILRRDEEVRRQTVQTTWQNPLSSSPFIVPCLSTQPFFLWAPGTLFYKTETGSCLAGDASVNNTKPSRDIDSHTTARQLWGALEGGTLPTVGVWLPCSQPTPDMGATLTRSGSCSLLSSWCALSLHSFTGDCFLTLGMTAMCSEKGVAAFVSEWLRNDKVELTSVFPPHRIPSCLMLKGTDKTL